jgi:YD repeat-containing protein
MFPLHPTKLIKQRQQRTEPPTLRSNNTIRTCATRNENFGYDYLNRLTSSSTPTGSQNYWAQSFVYDAWGNLKNVVGTNAPAFAEVTRVSHYFRCPAFASRCWTITRAGTLWSYFRFSSQRTNRYSFNSALFSFPNWNSSILISPFFLDFPFLPARN